MAFRRKFNQGSVVVRSRRQTDWSILVIPVGTTNIAGNSKVLAASITAAALDAITPFTIVRTRGILSVGSDQRAATENQLGSLGIGLVNEVARALGVTALPGPSSQATDNRWFVHQFYSQRLSVTTDIGVEPNFFTQYVIDSKAMRKVTFDQGLVFMFENTAATGHDIFLSLRMLIKAG